MATEEITVDAAFLGNLIFGAERAGGQRGADGTERGQESWFRAHRITGIQCSVQIYAAGRTIASRNIIAMRVALIILIAMIPIAQVLVRRYRFLGLAAAALMLEPTPRQLNQ